MPIHLPSREILTAGGDVEPALDTLGRSREGRDIRGGIFGRGDLHVSLIGGCHADEPVGPEMLARLCRFLERLDPDASLLTEATWFIVPHVNPDGRARNEAWSTVRRPIRVAGRTDEGFDLALYLRRVVREQPGDDIEFGFPRRPGEQGVRPENRAVADFLSRGAPFAIHGSFHGMGFAPGPWFLIEPAWIERTERLRRSLRRTVAEMGYRPYDVDRGGEKGFARIDEGFSTRPDSVAMRAHFLAQGDELTAERFRPSSMELVRSLGGDPLTFVSENPLFLVAEGGAARLREELMEAIGGDLELRRVARRLGVVAMPIGDQMRLQLAFLEEALAAVADSRC